MVWQAPERLWLTADRTRVVRDGDPEARFLLAAGRGDEIPRADAIRYGLVAGPNLAALPPDHVLIERGLDQHSEYIEGVLGQTAGPRVAGVQLGPPGMPPVQVLEGEGDPDVLTEEKFQASGDPPQQPPVEDKAVRGPLQPSRRGPAQKKD